MVCPPQGPVPSWLGRRLCSGARRRQAVGPKLRPHGECWAQQGQQMYRASEHDPGPLGAWQGPRIGTLGWELREGAVGSPVRGRPSTSTPGFPPAWRLAHGPSLSDLW